MHIFIFPNECSNRWKRKPDRSQIGCKLFDTFEQFCNPLPGIWINLEAACEPHAMFQHYVKAWKSWKLINLRLILNLVTLTICTRRHNALANVNSLKAKNAVNIRMFVSSVKEVGYSWAGFAKTPSLLAKQFIRLKKVWSMPYILILATL